MRIDAVPMTPPKAITQLLKYGLVGVLTNLVGYGFYLLVTYTGISPKVTMTAMYSAGAAISFFVNKRFTFHHHGHVGKDRVRFFIDHMMGYLL